MSSEFNWYDVTPAVRADYTLAYFLLPAFEVNGIVWKGASEIVKQWTLTASKNFALRNRPTKPTNANYIACVRFRIGGDVYRYRLWDHADLVLPNVPLYNGEVIRRNAVLEIWNVNGQATASQTTPIRMTASIRRVISDFSAMPADYEDATAAAVASLQSADIVLPNPSAYGTLNLWLKADAGVTQAGGLVTKWADQSGHAYDLTPLIDSPGLLANGFGARNQPYLRFTAPDDGLVNAGAPAAAFQSYYIAMQVFTWALADVLLSDGARAVTFNPSDKKIRSAWVLNADVDYSTIAAKPFILRLDRTNIPQSTNRIQIVALEDYPTEVSAATVNTGGFAAAAANSLVLGVDVAAIFGIAELLAFNEASLSAANDQAVKEYLAQKYAAVADIPIVFGTGSAGSDNT
jgi:hypothetical protein